jgi:phosphopantetheine--protein transferase-like protein
MNEGLVPGNRNADNIEDSLHDMPLIFYPTKPVRCQVRAALLKSFGFGQVGGEVLVLHPDLVLGTLSQPALQAYLAKREAREAKAQAHTYRSLVSPADRLIRLKESPPFPADLEAQAYLDPTVRAAYDPNARSWVIGKAQLEASKKAFPAQTAALAKSLASLTSGSHGVGIDVQLVTDLPIDNADFLERNYTAAELEYCRAQPDVQASLAGRWAAKEAVVKALCSSAKDKPDWLQGPGGPLKDIEVLPSPTGAPAVSVKGKPMDSLKVSISHSGAYAVALAQLP